MLQEAPQELGGRECHLSLLVAARVILPAEGDALTVESQQAMIADGNTVGVTTEVAQNLPSATESWLGLDDPVLPEQRAEKSQKQFGLMWATLDPSVRHAVARAAFVDCWASLPSLAHGGLKVQSIKFLGVENAPAPRDLAGIQTKSLTRQEKGVEGGHSYDTKYTRDIVLANCPFDRLADEDRELVCGMNLSFVEGVLQGVDAGGATARLDVDRQPRGCCVRISTS